MDDLDPRDRATWPELMTTKQAAVVLDMSENQVRKLLASGDIQGRRFGGRWYVLKQPLLQPDSPHDIEAAREAEPEQ